MSTICGRDLESYVAYSHDLLVEGYEESNVSLSILEGIGQATRRVKISPEHFKQVVALYEEERELVERGLEEFDEEEQSWRDYSYWAIGQYIPTETLRAAGDLIQSFSK